MLNERIKLSARAALLGNRRDDALYLLALMICVVFFSVSGYAVNRIVSLARVNAALTALNPLLVQLIPAASSMLTLFFAVFFVSPLRQAARSRFVACALNRRTDSLKWFAPGHAVQAVRLSIALFFIKTGLLAAWLALPCAVSVILAAVIKNAAVDLRIALAAAVGTAVLFIISLVFYAVSVQAYVCAQYILVASPSTTVRSAIRQSKAKTLGCRAALLRFRLSFLPWFLLCLAVVPLFYVWPYYKQSLACYITME